MSTKWFSITLPVSFALLFSACTAGDFQTISNSNPQSTSLPSGQPGEQRTSQSARSDTGGTDNSAISVLGHEQARDAVVRTLTERFGLNAPLTWEKQDLTPSNLVGSSTSLFTGEAWTVKVSAPVVAPEYQIYQVGVDHLASGLHWQGTIDASGNLTEIESDPPFKVQTAEQVRDLAVAFVAEAKNLPLPAKWTLQPDDNPANGINAHTYVGGPWVVRVEYQASTPSIRIYDVVVDHMQAVLRWHGQVDANGRLEGLFLQGTSPRNN